MQESKSNHNLDKVVQHTILNVIEGIQYGHELHDIWMDENNQCYCLCKTEIDDDGEVVYTAYQLYMAPEVRGLAQVRRLVKFLKFFAQKQRYKRLYIPSSRIDNIKAYARGLGKGFKIKTVTFTKEL